MLCHLLCLLCVALAGSAPAADLRIASLDGYAVVPAGIESAGPADAASVVCASQHFRLQQLTLVEAVNLALCNNPQIRGAWAAVQVQSNSVGEARAAYYPSVSAGLTRLSDRTQLEGYSEGSTKLEGTAKNLGVNWRLFDFGERDANRQAATAMLGAAIASHEAVQQRILANIISSYFDAQTQMATVEGKQKNTALAAQILASAERREARGAGDRSDTLQAKSALAKASLEQVRADGAYRKSMATLVYALGIASNAPVSIMHDVPVAGQEARRELEDWMSIARRQHPALRAARAGVEAAKQKLRAQASQARPTLDFSGNFYQNGRPNQGLPPITSKETIVAVTLNIPIFDGFAQRYRVRGAMAQVEQRAAELEDAEHQILSEIVKAYADAGASLENLGASQQLLEAAQAALDSVQLKFEGGAANIVDVLNAEIGLSEARQERIRCLAEWRSARLILMANTGTLVPHELAP
ncbi:protein CyaE [Rugamonas sp. R1(2021)]